MNYDLHGRKIHDDVPALIPFDLQKALLVSRARLVE
jgi:hypothetical protein